MVLNRCLRGLLAAAVSAGAACATFASDASPDGLTERERLAILQRSQVWSPTDVPAMNIRTGPDGPGAFPPDETVTCTYEQHDFHGQSPKFQCALSPEDAVKVKFGRQNGEVYGEVAASRLLWALGFGADRMYPVRVVCRGCPPELEGRRGERPGEFVFDPATIERDAPGTEIESRPHEGWSWRELDLLEEMAGGAPRAHRDALKLLAVFIQHGDNKAEQQRLVCEETDCAHPFMLIGDLGLTFGRGDALSRNELGSVNFERWADTPVWKNPDGCVGKLPNSLRGSLHDPVISEAGRRFLSDLLAQLSDAQIADLFDVARFPLRSIDTPDVQQDGVPVEDWMRVFKEKRRDIASRRCGEPYAITPASRE